jgi:hypothetical protein
MINFKKVNWFFQKLFRGYSKRDLWSLDYHLADLILPRLIAFEKMKRNGVPGILCKVDGTEQDFEKESQEWESILDKMILAFQLIVDDKYESIEQLIERDKKIEEGTMLFGKYFRSLWD